MPCQTQCHRPKTCTKNRPTEGGAIMRRAMIGIVGVMAGVGLLASVAFATHEEPIKAKTFKVELVTAYDDCASGDGFSTDPPGLILPGCAPVRSDPTCNFQDGIGS